MSTSIQKITKLEQQLALASIESLTKSELSASKNKSNVIKITIGASNEAISIPLKALKSLTSILANMAEGKATTLLPTDTEISTQQAAEILNVSRPYIIKLLEKGDIPFKKVGSHRRVLLQDVLAYQVKFKKKRRQQLDLLAKEALGY